MLKQIKTHEGVGKTIRDITLDESYILIEYEDDTFSFNAFDAGYNNISVMEIDLSNEDNILRWWHILVPEIIDKTEVDKIRRKKDREDKKKRREWQEKEYERLKKELGK